MKLKSQARLFGIRGIDIEILALSSIFMDPFNDNFDPKIALTSPIPTFPVVIPAENFNIFEQEFSSHESGLSESLKIIEEREKAKKRFSSAKFTTKQRIQRLQRVCAPGQTPLTTLKDPQKLKSLRYSNNERTDDHFTGIIGCLKKWMTNRSRVFLKLRAQSSKHSLEPNRLLQGVIVAFDKHWNLVLRDVEEIYTPSIRLAKVQTFQGAMPRQIVYAFDPSSNDGRLILHRHLKCSMIIGNSIICIYEPSS